MSERETPKITVLPIRDTDPIMVARLVTDALNMADIRTIVEYWDPETEQLFSAIS